MADQGTLSSMIIGLYQKLDAADSAFVDCEWARMRGYILPSNGTSTLTLNEGTLTYYGVDLEEPGAAVNEGNPYQTIGQGK